MKRNEWVTYTSGRYTYKAIVRTVHKDGTMTVEAFYPIDESGKAAGAFIGYKLRLDRRDLRSMA